MHQQHSELVVQFHEWVRHVSLTDRPVVLGRAEDCDVVLDDRRISRHHCRLAPSGHDGWTLEDLGSQTGTFVGGVRIDSPRSLAHGERFQVGPMHLHIEVRRLATVLSGDLERDTRTVEILLRTIDDLYATPSIDAVLKTIVDRALLLTGAERGAILLSGDGSLLDAAIARSHDGHDLSADEVLTRSLPLQILRSGQPVVLTDVADAAQAMPDSVLAGSLRSVVCVPLPGGDRPIGVLYADGQQPVRGFGGAELAVLEALAQHSALALERARVDEEQRRVDWHHQRRLTDEVEALRTQLGSENPVGDSAPMRAAVDLLRRVAPSDVTILLAGETGTGKEVLARYLHRLSPRAKGPFVVVDCGSIPEGLIESELFGHERGAFTGATTASQGRFREAQGGTVLLDEVGELPLLLQTRLLRVLQERTVQPIGATGRTDVNVRIIGATHRDLAARVAAGQFRQDLYYRLSIVAVSVPPLRDRGDDILLLAQLFLGRFSSTLRAQFSGFTRDAREALLLHQWPGNVRELENRIHRAVLLAQPPFITRADLGLGDASAAAPTVDLEVSLLPLPEARAEATARFEQHYLQEVLRRADGKVTRAAHLAGVTRGLLQRMLREHGIDRSRFVADDRERDEDAPP
jgi:transcriptional regulator with GAF, ATPase, and Fis domain